MSVDIMNILNRIAENLSASSFAASVTAGLVLLATAGISHASTPFTGTPISIPGTIEMEDYDLGGEGDAYHDVDAGNNGPASYRTDDVDHEACSEGGFNVGWTATGEWLKYTVNVASNGSYTITAHVASAVTTGAFHVEVDDVDVSGSISVGTTGGWQTWEDRTAIVTLSAGQQVVKLVIEGNDLNIDRLDITYNGPPPVEPTALQVDSTGANSVSLSWKAPVTGSPTGYNVKRATSSGGTYATVGSPATTAFTDSVTGGSTYYYVVSALTASGESADSAFVSATPALGVPGPPTGLAANSGDNQVVLSWTASAVGSPTSYNVLRSTTSGSDYAAITTPGAQTTTSFVDNTAVNGTTYYYVVSAVNATGEGARSTEASATPAVFSGIYEPFDYPVGNLPNSTAATADGFGTWTCGIDGTVYDGLSYTGLPVENNALQSAGTRQFVSLDDPISSGTKWISFLYYVPGNMGANHNGVYFPNSSASCLFFGFGLSPLSGTQGELALGSMTTAGTTALGATQLALLGAGTYGTTYLVAMEIQFDTSGNNDTVTVYLNPVANQAAPGVPAAGTVSSFDVGTISGVGLNVQAGGWVGLDEIRIADTYADAVDAVTTAPDTPSGLNATTGNNLVSLSWTAAGGGLSTGYNVKRSSSSGGPYTTIGTTSVPTVTYDDAIVGGQTYYYVVSAVNGVGESADSSYVSAMPVLAAPDTPGGLSAVAGDSQVSLSWSASDFTTVYDVKRSADFAGPYSSVGTTGALTYNDSDLNNSVTYYYVIAAIGVGGSSADSSPVSATPFGPLPLVLDIDPGVGITWFASNSATYQVQWAVEDMGTNTVWNNLGQSIYGDGTTNTVFDPVGAPHNVYQVISY
ncbi:carbohydrate-binding protein [Pontiellaceae bacterium B1224]|nr:carbohydrate-binding protein [Pontiellaceae bacterium B1224]